MSRDREEDQINIRALAGALGDLCKEGGATPERTDALLGPFDLEFPDPEGDDTTLRDYIELASSLIVDSQHRMAIRNALGFDDERAAALNLTERRSAHLRSNDSVSPRTLIRHEREGALALAQILATMDAEEVVVLPFSAVEAYDELADKYDAAVDALKLVTETIGMDAISTALHQRIAAFEDALRRAGWSI